jgi:hypothetical protein
MPDALISYPFTNRGVLDALKALGTTADAVARNLEAMGFKGCQSSENNCPVANYLLSAITGARRVGVSTGYADVWDADDGDDPVSADWTAAVDEFIELFDNGRFPALEAPDASS